MFSFWYSHSSHFILEININRVGPVTGLSVSFDGLYAATISTDCTLKIYDVLTFGILSFFILYLSFFFLCFSDMIAIIQLGFNPSACCWTSVSSTLPVIAVSEETDIHFYDINCTTKKDGRGSIWVSLYFSYREFLSQFMS